MRMAVVDLDDPPSWWSSQSKHHLSAHEARELAETDGEQITVPRKACFCLLNTVYIICSANSERKPSIPGLVEHRAEACFCTQCCRNMLWMHLMESVQYAYGTLLTFMY